MNIIAVDIGNTNIDIGLFLEDKEEFVRDMVESEGVNEEFVRTAIDSAEARKAEFDAAQKSKEGAGKFWYRFWSVWGL